MLKWRTVIAYAVMAALALVIGLLLCRKPVPAKPPTISTVTDTLWSTESTFTVHYRPDPALSKELAALRAELAGKQGFIDRLVFNLDMMTQESQYLTDSCSRLLLDSLRGIVKVTRGPAGIAVVSYERGLVQRFSFPVWRQRWTLLAGRQKPAVKTARFPLDLGLTLGGGFSTRSDTWAPAPFAWTGLSVTRQCATVVVGPVWDGALKLRGEMRFDWKW